MNEVEDFLMRQLAAYFLAVGGWVGAILTCDPPLYGQSFFSDDGRATIWSWPDRESARMETETDESADAEEDEPIETDRPDFTEASSTVGRGKVQLETGYTYFRSSAGGISARSHSWGEPLLRVGMWREWFEFRLALSPVTTVNSTGIARQRDSGWEDLYLGCKLGLTEQKGVLPEVALVPQATLPTGSAGFTNQDVLPGMNLLYGWDLNQRLSCGGSTQWNSTVGDPDETYLEWAQSLTVGWQFSDPIKGYAEWFALFPDDTTAASVEHYFNGGLTYLFNPDVQWDIRAGVGLSEAAGDFFAGTGISFRTGAFSCGRPRR